MKHVMQKKLLFWLMVFGLFSLIACSPPTALEIAEAQATLAAQMENEETNSVATARAIVAEADGVEAAVADQVAQATPEAAVADQVAQATPGAAVVNQVAQATPGAATATDANKYSIHYTNNVEWIERNGYAQYSRTAVAEEIIFVHFGGATSATAAPYFSLQPGDWMILWVSWDGRVRPFGLINHTGNTVEVSLGQVIELINGRQEAQITTVEGAMIAPVQLNGSATNVEDLFNEALSYPAQYGWGYADINILNGVITLPPGKFTPWR